MSSPRRGSRDNSTASVHRLDQNGPRRMRAAGAARYMGVSESTFLNRVKEGVYPSGRKEFGIVLWLRDDLDDYIDRQFGVAPANDADRRHEDPFAARFQRAS